MACTQSRQSMACTAEPWRCERARIGVVQEGARAVHALGLSQQLSLHLSVRTRTHGHAKMVSSVDPPVWKQRHARLLN